VSSRFGSAMHVHGCVGCGGRGGAVSLAGHRLHADGDRAALRSSKFSAVVGAEAELVVVHLAE
jgi:hypothetical protein